jgi:cation:H+ antiporter
MLEFLLLSCGLAGLWAGSEVLIRGAISLSDRFNMSDAVIGMLILAVGTDLPELFVAADASLRSLSGEDLSGIVIGSAIGSSIGQFALVIGAVGFIGFKPRPWLLGLRNSVFLLGGLLLLAAFSFDGVITRNEGWGLAGCYGLYFLTLIIWRALDTEPPSDTPAASLTKDLLLLVFGLALLLLAAELTVVYAHRFAHLVGLSNLSVSAVIIGLGSSLPELSVSLVAIMKNRVGLSVGNLMGSNVLDTLLVPGVGAIISPLVVPVAVLWLDLPVQALVTVLVLGFLYVSPRGVKTAEACLLLVIYAGYAFARIGS